MGKYLFDQYTLLHFSVGIIAYFWNINIFLLFILHTIFEILENTNYGMKLINKYFIMWPGGKPKQDSLINILGDTIGVLVGWIIAYLLDKYGNKQGWYPLHIK